MFRNFCVKKIKNTICTLILLFAFYCVSGCGTIRHGGAQAVKVNSDPPNAVVTIFNKSGVKVYTGNSPAVVSLSRKSEYNVVITMEGYKEVKIHINKKIDERALVGNLILTGSFIVIPIMSEDSGSSYLPVEEIVYCGSMCLPLLIDFFTGSASKIEPNEITVTLVRANNEDNEEELYSLFQYIDSEGNHQMVCIPMIKR